jgi:hypothetical protein
MAIFCANIAKSIGGATLKAIQEIFVMHFVVY